MSSPLYRLICEMGTTQTSSECHELQKAVAGAINYKAAVLNFLGTRDRCSHENLMPKDLRWSRGVMLALGSGCIYR